MHMYVRRITFHKGIKCKIHIDPKGESWKFFDNKSESKEFPIRSIK